MRRGVLIALGVLFALVIIVLLGVASPPGTRWIARTALSVANERVNGAIRVGRVAGSAFGSLTFTDVEILNRSGERLVAARRMELGFSPIGLLQRDIVLDPLIVEGLFLRLIPRTDGVGYTISDVFAGNDTTPATGPAPRVVIENARIIDGTVLLHGRADAPMDNGETGGDGITTIANINAVFPVARLSSPDSTEPMMFEIAEASASMADPPVALRELRGRIELGGDTIRIGDAEIVTSRSRAQVNGWFVQDSSLVLAGAELSVAVQRLETSEFTWLADSLPPGLVVSGTVTLRGAHDALRLDLEAQVAESAGTELGFLDTEGTVALTSDEHVRFTGLDIAVLRADLTRARRAGVPVPTDGRLSVQGRLTGTLTNPLLQGSVAFADGSGRSTNLRGTMGVRYDDRLLGVIAHVTLDSLWLAQAGEAVPGAELQGALGGTIDAEGPLSQLPFDVQLGGPAGRVAASGTLRWVQETLTVDTLFVRLDELDASQVARGARETNLNAVLQAGGIVVSDRTRAGRATVQVSRSSVDGLVVDSAWAHLQATREQLLVDTVVATGPGLHLAAGGHVALVSTGTHELTGRLQVDSLRTLADLLGDTALAQRPLTGSAAARFTLTGTPGDVNLVASVTSSRVLWGDYVAAGLVVDANWHQASRGIEATARADSIAIPALRLGEVTAGIEGSDSSWNWWAAMVAQGQGQWAGGGYLVADATGYGTRVDSLIIELGGVAWTAEEGGRIAVTGGSQVTSDLVLRRSDGPGRVAVVGTLPSVDSAHMEVSIDSLPFSDVVRLLGDTITRVEGRLNGRLVIDGRADAPRYDLAAFLTEATLDTVTLPSIQVEARYAEGQAHGTAAIVHEGRNLVRAEAAMPGRIGFPPDVRTDSAPITITIEIDSIPGSLVDRLVPSVRDVGGALAGNVEVTGTLDSPDMRGELIVSNGRVTLPALGTSWRDMQGTLRFAGDLVTVDRLRLSDNSGGDLVANGTVKLDRLADPLLNLQLQARDFALIDTEEYAGVDASGQVSLTGRPRSMALSGFLNVAAAEIRVAEVASADIIDLSDSLFASFVDTAVLGELRVEDEFSAALLDGLRIDSLRVTVGQDVWVRSEEANIQLAGGILVRKYGQSYPITGEIRAVRGTYDIALGPGTRRRFTVTGGTISFLRTDSLDADLSINARHELRTIRGDPMTVNVHIGGTISAPRIQLTSDRSPALPQTEIISYLMFGAPTAQVFVGRDGRQRRSFFEAGAEQFSALLAGRLEGTFSGALDYFAITPGDPSGGFSEAEILVGKQLDLFGAPSFVTVSPRLCPGQPIAGLRRLGLSVEMWLARQWMLDASLDPRRGCATPTTTGNTLQLGIDLLWVKK